MTHCSLSLLLFCSVRLPQVRCSGTQPADWRGGHGDHQDDGQRGQAGRIQQRSTLPGTGERHHKWHIHRGAFALLLGKGSVADVPAGARFNTQFG
jgi:hypothetical protein